MKTINDYAELVKEEHALNKTLAPVEDDLTGASQPYAKGAKFINNGIMCQAKTDIAQGDALVLNTNYEAAPDVETQIANEAATRSAMGAKNKLPFDLATIKANNTTGTWNNNVYTLNGVDFTFNADGSVLVDGTASANAEVDYLLNLSISGDFILSDAVAGVASNYWAFAKVDGDSANLLILTSDEMPASISSTMDYFRIKVFSGKTASNVLFKPMLRLATDADPTFQPYAKTNKELTNDVSSLNSALSNKANTSDVVPKTDIANNLTTSTAGKVLDATQGKVLNDAFTNNVNQNGCKNLLPNKLTSKTEATVVITVDNDGIITLNGTASANFNTANTTIYNSVLGIEGTFILSDGASGETSNTKCMYYGINGGSTAKIDESVEITLTKTDTLLVGIYCSSGTVLNDFQFKPMLCLKSDYDIDATYVSYAMTNRELTNDAALVDLTASTKKSGQSYLTTTYAYAKNGIVNLFWVSADTLSTSETVVGELPEGYRPLTQIYFPLNINGSFVDGYCKIKANGEICFKPTSSAQYIGVQAIFFVQ